MELDKNSWYEITLISIIKIIYHSKDGAVGPNCDCVVFQGPVDMAKDGLHGWKILIIWDTEWVLIVTNHLEVGWGRNELKGVISVTTFREILEPPGF